MEEKTIDGEKLLPGAPLADGEYTYAPSTFSLWRITPEQREWVEKYNEAIGILNTTGDRTKALELGILSDE